MKKTNLLLLIMLLMFTSSFAQQQIETAVNYAKSTPYKEITTAFITNKNATIINSEGFENYGSETNGAPTNWVVNATNSDTLNQWRWLETKGNPAACFGATYLGTNTDRDENLITSIYSVPALNPVLTFDFFTSYYWFVTKPNNDLKIYITNDDGTSWNLIWEEDNQALVEASGVPWPYSNWTWFTANVDLSAYANDNVKFKFHLTADNSGVDFLLDNIGIASKNNNDLMLSKANSSFGSQDNLYSYMPFEQVTGDLFSNAIIKNIGAQTQTGINLDYSINKNESTVYSENITSFASGGNSLNPNTVDTFRISHAFSVENNSNYTVNYTVNQSETEEDINDNSLSYLLNINSNRFSRYHIIDIGTSLSLYSNATQGDFLGNKFVFNTQDTIKSVSCKITNGTNGGVLQAKVYFLNGSNYELVAESDAYYTSTSDVGHFINLELLNKYIAEAGTYIIGFTMDWSSSEKVYIGAQNGGEPYSMLNFGGTWYQSSSNLPAIDVYLYRTPSIISNTGSNACEHENVQLQLTPSNPGTTFQWYFNGTILTGETTDILYLNDITTLQSGTYSCVNEGETMSYNLSVSQATEISNNIIDTNICEGAEYTFNINASGSNLSYQWQFNGSDISNANTNSYTISDATTVNSGNYICIVTGDCGVLTDTANLIVNTLTSVNIEQTNFVTCESANVNLSTITTGTNLTYQWQFNGNNISDSTLSTFDITNISVADAGVYSCVVTGVCGTETDDITIDVNPVYNLTDTVIICDGETYDFGGQALTIAGNYTSIFTSLYGCDSTVNLTLIVNPTYNETDAVTICDGETYIFGTQLLSTSGEYTEVFQSLLGCDSTVTLTLNVEDKILLNSFITNASCGTSDGSVSFTFTGGDNLNYTYTWNGGTPETGQNPTINNLALGVYPIEVNSGVCSISKNVIINEQGGPNLTIYSSANAICLGETVNLSAQGATSYVWSPESTIDNPNQANVTAIPTETTEFHVTGTTAGCSVIAGISVVVNPTYNETDAVTICEDETYTFGTQLLSIAGEYTEVFQSQLGCDSTVVLNLIVNPTYNETDAVTICDGEIYTFGTQLLSIAGEYTEVFQSQLGCDSTVVLNLIVNPTYNETDAVTICEGETYTFGTQLLSIAGEYTEVFQSQLGCDSTVVLSLIVNPVYAITEADTTVCNNTEYTFPDGTSQIIIADVVHESHFQAINTCDSVITTNVFVETVDVVVTQNQEILTAQATSVNYQWIDCDNNNQAITDETNQSFTVTQNGNYAVIIDNGNCSDTSECVNVIVDNVKMLDKGYCKIYPNPAHNQLTINNEQLIIENIEICDITGKTILKSSLRGGTTKQSVNINISNLENGLYLIKIKTINEYLVKQFIKN